MTMAQKILLLMRQLPNPWGYPLAARYSLDGSPSDDTYLIDGSNNLLLIADRSGNSVVKGLVTDGTTGNNASTPDSVPLNITADIDVRSAIALPVWPPAALTAPLAKRVNAASNISWRFQITSGGLLQFLWSANGTTEISQSSTVAISASNYALIIVRATLDVDNGAGGYDVKFWTKTSTPSSAASDILVNTGWTQLGTTVTGAAPTSINAGTTPLTVGSLSSGGINGLKGITYASAVLSGIGGTVVFNPNFTTVSKLAATFVESSSNAATVTINSTGDTGARISLDRDLYQGTAGKRAIFSTVAGKNQAIADGINDYYTTASFILTQPLTVMLVGAQNSWTINNCLMDGGVTDTLEFFKDTSSPNVSSYAGAVLGPVTQMPLSVKKVLGAVFNGANSMVGVAGSPIITGDIGTGVPNGVTLAGQFGGGANTALLFNELVIYSLAFNQTLFIGVGNALKRFWATS